MPLAAPLGWCWTLVTVWPTWCPSTRASPSHTPSCVWTSPAETSPDTSVCCCARKATTSTHQLSSRWCAPSKRWGRLLHKHFSPGLKKRLIFCFSCSQRACYLSLNPQKDETLETEKAQYVLPDGSTLNVSPAESVMVLRDVERAVLKSAIPLSDRTGQIPCPRAAVQTRPDRRRELRNPRGPGLRHPEVWHGPAAHALFHHRTMRRVNTDQRLVMLSLWLSKQTWTHMYIKAAQYIINVW